MRAWTTILSLVAFLMMGFVGSACGGDDGPPRGAPCTICSDGVFQGEAEPGGGVRFEIRDGHLQGTFDIVAETGCGPLPLELGHVYLDGESFRSELTADTIIDITGQMLGPEEAEGRYDVTWVRSGETCSASGLWSATLL